MPILTLKDAAEYVRTSKASQLLLTVLRAAGKIFSFTEERSNRMNRYVSVVRAYEGGMAIDAICEKYGCTKRTVYDYVHRAGITPRTFKPEEIKRQVLEDYKAGIPVRKIAELRNVSFAYVSKLARDANLPRRKPGPKAKK